MVKNGEMLPFLDRISYEIDLMCLDAGSAAEEWLALGATPIETYFKVSVPAAKSGIAAAVVLGVGRAIGEAMAVMMVSGNVPNMPSLFQSVRFLTTAVATEAVVIAAADDWPSLTVSRAVIVPSSEPA